MGLLTSPLCCAAQCCGCIILSQLIALLISFGSIILFILFFYFYVLPWGEDKIISELGLPAGTTFDSIDPGIILAQNCSGCIFGTNTDWPTTTTGMLHFLDTSAGTSISTVVATTLVATAAASTGTMLWASIFPSMASALSLPGGFYEMTHILEQAQYIGMIGQLQLRGAPEFLNQFSKELAWTNFNLPESVTTTFIPSTRRRRLVDIAETGMNAVQPKFDGETGPAKYAKTLGVEPSELFFYTLKLFAAVVVVIHVLYLVVVMVASCLSKKESFGQIAGKWYRKVVWACLLALLLAQYIFAMTGSYYIYENTQTGVVKDSMFAVACALFALVIGFALLFGILVIANNTEELRDIGTIDHDNRAFASKYSAYYDEYNFDNRFFFVPRILLAVGTGIVVGVIQDPTKQLFFILGATFLYLVLVILREPNLLRFLYYIALASVLMKFVLVCLMLVLAQDDFFPQAVRDKVAYAIIGINIFIFFLLFLRQAYLIIYKVVRACKHKGKNTDDSDDDDDRNNRRDMENANRNGRYERLNSANEAEAGRGRPNDPYAQSQQAKQQSYLAQQGVNGYGRGDVGMQGSVQGGVAGGYGANARLGPPPSSPNDIYGPPGVARQSGPNQRPSGGPGQNRYGNGAEPVAFGPNAQSGVAGRPQGRSIADRYIGADAGAAAAGGVAAGAAVAGAGVAAAGTSHRRSQDPDQRRPSARAPEPEKFTWRRNMEQRRAAEAAAVAAAEEAARPPPPPQRGSMLRIDSDDSYTTSNGNGTSDRSLMSGNHTGAGGDTSARSMQRFSTDSTDDWFNNRAPSDMDSSMSSTIVSKQAGFNAASISTGSPRYDDDLTSSFMTADSYASTRKGDTGFASQRSIDSSLDGSTEATGIARSDTRNLDNLAVAYLQRSGDGAARAENDIGDDDDEEDDAATPLMDFPKDDHVDTDKDETESVDIDGMPDEDSDEEEDGKKEDLDIDVDVDVDDADSDRDSIDIDASDEGEVDVDIDIDDDTTSSRDNESMLDSTLSSAGRDSHPSIQRVDEIGLRDSVMSYGSPSHSHSSLRDSYLSVGSGYERGMSQVSTRSDDDASFYIDGRHQTSPSAQERQQGREKLTGPLKM